MSFGGNSSSSGLYGSSSYAYNSKKPSIGNSTNMRSGLSNTYGATGATKYGSSSLK